MTKKIKYNWYLITPMWQEKRQQVLKRDNHTCQKCGETEGKLSVHHLTYNNVGCENLYELITLCSVCRAEAKQKELRDNTHVVANYIRGTSTDCTYQGSEEQVQEWVSFVHENYGKGCFTFVKGVLLTTEGKKDVTEPNMCVVEYNCDLDHIMSFDKKDIIILSIDNDFLS